MLFLNFREYEINGIKMKKLWVTLALAAITSTVQANERRALSDLFDDFKASDINKKLMGDLETCGSIAPTSESYLGFYLKYINLLYSIDFTPEEAMDYAFLALKNKEIQIKTIIVVSGADKKEVIDTFRNESNCSNIETLINLEVQNLNDLTN